MFDFMERFAPHLTRPVVEQALTLKSSGKLDLTTMAILEMSAESFGVFPLRTMRGRPVDHLQVMRKSVRQLSTAGLDPDNAQ